MTVQQLLPAMPFEQDDILQIAPEYLRLQHESRAVRVRTPAGDPGWLVTRHADVKALIADPRIGRTHRDPKNAARVSQSLLLGGPVGDFDREHEMHNQARALLAPAFTARRTAQQRDFVSASVARLLDEIESDGPPVELHERLSFRLPLLVICTMLGIPESEWPKFEGISHRVAEAADRASAGAALISLIDFMREMIAAKRSAMADDLISDLLRADDRDGVGTEMLSFLAASLLFAGHETIASRIDFGLLMLLENKAALGTALTDPKGLDACVEEVLRLATPNDLGQARYAREDIELDDVTIAAGDAVILAIGAANRDPEVFADPLRLDVTRRPNPHLTFGFGKHFCLGAALARLELGIILEQLFRRFPGLALAVPRAEIELRETQVTGGIVALPVTW